MAVCSLALEDGADEDEAVAALLHDGPEDQGGQPVLNRIRRDFGSRVADIVAGLSDTLEAPKPDWGPRKQAYLGRLMTEEESVLRVSLADKLHNARSMLIDVGAAGDAVWARFNAGRDAQAEYFRRLLWTFETRLPASRNLPEFRRVIAELFGSKCAPRKRRASVSEPDGRAVGLKGRAHRIAMRSVVADRLGTAPCRFPRSAATTCHPTPSRRARNRSVPRADRPSVLPPWRPRQPGAAARHC